MTPRQLLIDAIRCHETERPAWVPFVGVHGGHLAGCDAEAYLAEPGRIIAGVSEAIEQYQPDGVPVVFDLQLEAEVLGCALRWAAETPPSVSSHPLADTADIDLPPFDTEQGRYPIVGTSLSALRETYPDTGFYGLIAGPFTLSSHLRGNELFLDLLLNPDGVRRLLDFCAATAMKAADFYLERGADVIAVVDPMISQIGGEHFEQFVAPCLNAVFSHIREKGGLSSLFVCGDATRHIEAMCRTQCDNISVDENVSLPELRGHALAQGKSFGGNLKLTTALLLGSELDAARDTLRCMDEGGPQGFILAPGCDLPYNTPPANLAAVSRMVHDPYQRDVIRATVAAETEALPVVHLPDYPNEPTVFIDVVTLDSAACAPCQYMVEAVRQAAAMSGVATDVREHKIKTRDGLGHMRQLKVNHIPTICIDGKARFVSVIPDSSTLSHAITEAAGAKCRD